MARHDKRLDSLGQRIDEQYTFSGETAIFQNSRAFIVPGNPTAAVVDGTSGEVRFVPNRREGGMALANPNPGVSSGSVTGDGMVNAGIRTNNSKIGCGQKLGAANPQVASNPNPFGQCTACDGGVGRGNATNSAKTSNG